MRFLVTNDDGINASGIKALSEVLLEFGDVTVVAPSEEKSACGHGITVHQPLTLFDEGSKSKIDCWALNGTPADCVKFALEELLEKEPDWVFSGINQGPNLGTDVIYSGTVAGAVEGFIAGINSVAFSFNSHTINDFSFPKQIARDLVLKILEIKNKTLLNINIPNSLEKEYKGFKVCKLGFREYSNKYSCLRQDEKKSKFQMFGSIVPNDLKDLIFDTVAIQEGFTTISPLKLDRTDHSLLEVYSDFFK